MEVIYVATSTFDKVFIITDPEDQKRIIDVVSSDKPAQPIKAPLYTQKERERNEELFKQYASRSNS